MLEEDRRANLQLVEYPPGDRTGCRDYSRQMWSFLVDPESSLAAKVII